MHFDLFVWAPAHRVSRLELRVFANNPGAIRLYERVGFVQE
jgi:RimJ/RimL family protein N-acetyltransferase